MRIWDCGKGRVRSMDKIEFKQRTKVFALRVIRLVESLPRTRTANTIGNQLIRSGTSVGANYRAACRSRSNAEFIAKMGIEEEADESMFWMELLMETGTVRKELLESLFKEANEIVAIVVSSIKSSRGNTR